MRFHNGKQEYIHTDFYNDPVKNGKCIGLGAEEF